MTNIIPIILGFLLDLIIGDPKWLYHPVRIIGNMISKGEKITRKLFKNNEFLAGAVLSIFTVIVSFIVPFIILILCQKLSIILKIIVESIFIFQILATKSLKTESMIVYKYLKKNDLKSARKYLSYIVGRDTENLNEIQITKATVETVAENTSDGIIAPLFYISIFGAPLGFFYKAVNTLDSMIGYKNEKYMYFGRFAAKMDDVFNYIPAIIASYVMMISSMFLKMDYKNAFKIYKRDRHKSSSPNSAKTESVASGALRIELLGDAYYFGKLVKKQTIGDSLRVIEVEDIKRMNMLMYLTSIITVILIVIIRYLIYILI